MPFPTEIEVRAAAHRATRTGYKATDSLLREARDSSSGSFDIFLSHSYMDQEIVLGAKQLLDDKGLTVYVDWIDDPLLDRRDVTRATAELIRKRMRLCHTLVYLHSKNSTRSKWCPWELGYFDAFTHPERRVFILPITGSDRSYTTQEYLNLYDTIDIDAIGTVNRNPNDLRVKDAVGNFRSWRRAT